MCGFYCFFFSSRRRHTRCLSDWSSDVCSSDLVRRQPAVRRAANRMYFRLRKTLAGVDLETEHANLSIMSRKAANTFLDLKDVHRNFLLILYWLGFEHRSEERRVGKESRSRVGA